MNSGRAIGEAGVPLYKEQRQPKERKRLQAKGPIRGSNPQRQAAKVSRNFTGERDGAIDHRAFIVSLPCAALMQHRSDVDPAHVVPRGMGGVKGTWRDLVPLCRPIHRELDKLYPDAFNEKHGVNLWGLRHALVIADPGATRGEHHQAWIRLLLEVPDEGARGRVVQHAWDLCGYGEASPMGLEDIMALEAAP